MKSVFQSFLSIILLCCASTLWADITEVSNAELKSLIEKGVPVIDVRRQDEWEKTGIIDGVHTLTFFDKQGRYDANKWLAAFDKIVPKGQPVILICERGVRSKNIAGLLDKRLGLTGVHNHTRGMSSWVEKGHPVVSYSAEYSPKK